MQLTSSRVSGTRLSLITLGIFTLLPIISQTAAARNTSGDIHIPKHHETGHVHDHGNLPWPPNPDKMTNIVDFSKSSEEQTRHLKKKQRFDDLERKNHLRKDLKDALGNKFTRIEVVDKDNKDRPSQSAKYVYFSLDKNSTVEVLTENGELKSVKSTPANEYQPEITDEETELAVQLAQTYFVNRGFTRVNELTGYGILAYSPSGRGFFSGRVIYVSFHATPDAPPEFMAWVNLTTKKIIKSREER